MSGWEIEMQGLLPFERDLVISDKVIDLSTIWKELAESKKNRGIERRRQLEADGIRIFYVKAENDFTALEMDYGAPAYGLDFFPELLNAQRSYRYEPVHMVESTHKTHVPLAIEIGKTLKAGGYHIFNKLSEDCYPSQIHFTNGGVTRAFNDVLKSVIGEFQNIQGEQEKHGRKQTAAILVPVPTYGLFLYVMEEAVKDTDINIIRIRRHDNGAVDQNSLNMALQECRLKNQRPIAYYDANPHNPTGYVRGRAETKEIGERLLNEGLYWVDRDLEYLESQPRDSFLLNWHVYLDKPHGKIILIDDMAYEGLEFDRRKKPYSFAQISAPLADITATLKGISKIGMPGLRAGMLIGHNEIVEPLSDKQLLEEFTAGSLGVDILAARFSNSPHREKFDLHIERLRTEHMRKVGIIESFFNGIQNTKKLSVDEKNKLITEYAEQGGIDKRQARKILSQGLAPFHLAEEIGGGFFHRVNFESMRGKTIHCQLDTHVRPHEMQVEDSYDLYWIFRSFGMKAVSAAQQGCDEKTLMARITISLPDEDLLKFFDKMTEMRDYFFGPNPEIQLDLLRKNHPTPSI